MSHRLRENGTTGSRRPHSLERLERIFEKNAIPYRRCFEDMVRCQTEVYKAYTEDGDFREWLNGEMFRLTYGDQK